MCYSNPTISPHTSVPHATHIVHRNYYGETYCTVPRAKHLAILWSLDRGERWYNLKSVSNTIPVK